MRECFGLPRMFRRGWESCWNMDPCNSSFHWYRVKGQIWGSIGLGCAKVISKGTVGMRKLFSPPTFLGYRRPVKKIVLGSYLCVVYKWNCLEYLWTFVKILFLFFRIYISPLYLSGARKLGGDRSNVYGSLLRSVFLVSEATGELFCDCYFATFFFFFFSDWE